MAPFVSVECSLLDTESDVDLDSNVPYVTFDEIFDAFPDVSAEWELIDGLEIPIEWGPSVQVRFLESTNAGTKFEIAHPSGTYETVYLGKLRQLLGGRKIPLGAASQTRLSSRFAFVSQKERDEKEELRKRMVRDQKRARLKREKELVAQREREEAEREEKRQKELEEYKELWKERARNEAALRAQREKEEHERRLELRKLMSEVQSYFGDAIPVSVELTPNVVKHLLRAIEEPDAFRRLASQRDSQRPNRFDDYEWGYSEDFEEWIALATARAILAIKDYNDAGHAMPKLSMVSSWWRKAENPQISISFTDRIYDSFGQASSAVKVSRAAAICDCFGSRTDSEAHRMMAHAVELDRSVLASDPDDQFAQNQLGRTLSLSGAYKEGVRALVAANNDPNRLRSELSATLKYMENDSRSSEYRAMMEIMADDGELPRNALPF